VVELLPVVSRAVGLFEDKARAKRVSIRVEGINALPAVRVTRSDVEQVCFLLIDNAIQAADGRKDRMLTIRGETVDSRIILRFEDDCGGIPVEHVDQVFQLFFTTKPSGEGMGMGLWIVDQIVSKAGGKVSLENRVGEGSTFVINLPL
jgi:signal transduction histidine kinase